MHPSSLCYECIGETPHGSPGFLAPRRATSLFGWCTVSCVRSIFVTVWIYRSGRDAEDTLRTIVLKSFLFCSFFPFAPLRRLLVFGAAEPERDVFVVCPPRSENLSSRVCVTALSLLAGLRLSSRDALEAESDPGRAPHRLVVRLHGSKPNMWSVQNLLKNIRARRHVAHKSLNAHKQR